MSFRCKVLGNREDAAHEKPQQDLTATAATSTTTNTQASITRLSMLHKAFHRKAVAATALASLATVSFLSACSTSQNSTATAAATTESTAIETALGPAVSPPAEASPRSEAQSTVGSLVEGFPTAILPVMAGAQVKQSAYDSSQTPATASLVLVTDTAAEEITNFYTKAFQDQGFSPLEKDATESVVGVDFVRNNGAETINVSIVPGPSGSNDPNTVTLAASVSPETLTQSAAR